MSEEETLTPTEVDEMGTIILMLGLYLIVLAFFILLNAISETSEQKMEAVSESMGEGFGFELEGPSQMRDEVEVTVDPVFDIVSNDIKSVIQSYVSVKDYRISSSADKMLLRLKSSKVFMPSQVRIRPSMAELFTDLSDIVANARPGIKMSADVIVYGLEKEAEKSPLSAHELAGRRAALFVRALIERGVDEKVLSASAVVAENPEVKIFFKMNVVNENEALKEAKRLMRKQQQMMQPVTPAADEPAPSGH